MENEKWTEKEIRKATHFTTVKEEAEEDEGHQEHKAL